MTKLASNPVFIGGTQRSGTSLLRALIDSNSRIFFPRAEMKFFVSFYPRLPRYEPIGNSANLQKFLMDYASHRSITLEHEMTERLGKMVMDRNGDRDWAAIYDTLMREFAKGEGKQRWGEKSPGNEFVTHLIRRFYPNAKIICLVRDPRAVVASSRRRYQKGILRPTLRWKQSVRKILHDYQLLPDRVFLIVYFEDLLLLFEQTMQRVFDFLNITPIRSLQEVKINQVKWKHGGGIIL